MAEVDSQGNEDSGDEGDSDSTESTDSSDNGDGNEENEEIDLAALQSSVDAVMKGLTGAASRTDLDAVKRQSGHIPGLQRQVEELVTAASKPNAEVAQIKEAFNILVEGLAETLPDSTRERLAGAQGTADTKAAVQEALAPVLEKLAFLDDDDDEDESVSAEDQSAWSGATRTVQSYATRKSVDISGWSPEVWKAAANEAGGDPDKAVELLWTAVDRIAEEGTPESRRNERKGNASGGKVTEKAGGAGSGGRPPLTVEIAKKMSPEQLMQYPREERAKLLRSMN